MSFSDILKKSIVDEFMTNNISLQKMIIILAVTFLIAGYIFIVYFLFTSKSFYCRNYNITLVGVTIVTAGIVIALQSNFVISLGMVGALSIVRFRTAIKEPLDLLFMFWAISVGIICGAELFALAIMISLAISIVLFLLQVTPIGKASLLLVVNLDNISYEKHIVDCVKYYYRSFQIKSRNVMNDKRVSMIIELKTKEQAKLLEEITAIKGVTGASLVAHDGEVNF